MNQIEIKNEKYKKLEEKTFNIRCHIIKTLAQAGSGHPGGCLSAVDILNVLYFEVMNIDTKNLIWEDRDRFVLSKGHASVALYATLAERGFFPTEMLSTYGYINSKLQGHVDMRKTLGVEMSSGSLGQGLSVGVEMCLEKRVQMKKCLKNLD